MATSLQYHRVVIGYHGCDRDLARRVLLEGEPLRKSHNVYDWLGEGIYFWEHGPERAMNFAREQVQRKKAEMPFVLGAYIHLGRCFDLTELEATGLLKGFYDDLKLALEASSAPMPENKSAKAGDDDLLLRYLDCAVLNLGLDDLDRNHGGVYYQTVRGIFPEGGPAFPGSKIMLKTHVQIAVRDPDCILGYFLPTPYNLSQEET